MMLSDVCLSVCVCGRPAGWRVLADRARLGGPGSRLPLRASVAGLGISWRPPAYSLLSDVFLLYVKRLTRGRRPKIYPLASRPGIEGKKARWTNFFPVSAYRAKFGNFSQTM